MRPVIIDFFIKNDYFNPRTPRGGATFSTTFATGAYWYFNPRTPRGGATVPPNNSGTFPAFQSTHPTRGCDFGCFHWLFSPQFQSTHPTRGCDGINNGWARSILISIHAPHEGVRHVQRAVQLTYNNFNPRTPRGGATSVGVQSGIVSNFNPRTPRGGATEFELRKSMAELISIHAPHEGVRPQYVVA